MADILTPDEVDALLSASEVRQDLGALLGKVGLDKRQTARVFLRLQEGAASDTPPQDVVAQAQALVQELLPEGKLMENRSQLLEEQLVAVHAEMFLEIETNRSPTPDPTRTQESDMVESPKQPPVCSYDFKHPARVNKDQLRTLENLHDNFARLLSSTFSGALGAVVDVDTAFVDQTTYGEFIMSLSNPSCSYQFRLGPTQGQAILDFAMPIVFAAVDRIHGGKGSPKGVDGRQLTQIEMGLIARIVKRVVQDLEATWEPILPVEISDIELETNPEFMQITPASEIVILLAFEVNSTHMSGLISLCYPFFTLESILPRLGQQTYVRRGAYNVDETIRANRARLANTEVTLAAELARGTITAGRARQVQVGDVLTCDTAADEPSVILVGGEPKFLGLPFEGPHGRNTLKISQVLDRAASERCKNRCRPVPLVGRD